MKKIVITGATGFLGKNVIETINTKKYDIWILGRTNYIPDDKFIHFMKCDLKDLLNVKKCLQKVNADILLMLAWDVTPNIYWEAFENHIWADISIQMAKDFWECGGKQIVFVGTSASYDYEKAWLKEQSDYEKPDTLYGMTKLYASKMIEKLAQQYGGTYCEARLFSIYGKYERESRLIPVTIQKLCKNQLVVNTKGNLIRDYIYAEDAARAIWLLIEKEAAGVYNVSTGMAVSISQIIKYIAHSLERESYVLFKETEWEGEFPLIVGDNSKLKSLGFQCRYDILDGIQASIKWFYSQNESKKKG